MEWLKLVDRKDLFDKRNKKNNKLFRGLVCDIHFNKSEILTDYTTVIGGVIHKMPRGKRQLKTGAKPSLYLTEELILKLKNEVENDEAETLNLLQESTKHNESNTNKNYDCSLRGEPPTLKKCATKTKQTKVEQFSLLEGRDSVIEPSAPPGFCLNSGEQDLKCNIPAVYPMDQVDNIILSPSISDFMDNDLLSSVTYFVDGDDHIADNSEASQCIAPYSPQIDKRRENASHIIITKSTNCESSSLNINTIKSPVKSNVGNKNKSSSMNKKAKSNNEKIAVKKNKQCLKSLQQKKTFDKILEPSVVTLKVLSFSKVCTASFKLPSSLWAIHRHPKNKFVMFSKESFDLHQPTIMKSIYFEENSLIPEVFILGKPFKFSRPPSLQSISDIERLVCRVEKIDKCAGTGLQYLEESSECPGYAEATDIDGKNRCADCKLLRWNTMMENPFTPLVKKHKPYISEGDQRAFITRQETRIESLVEQVIL